MRHLGRRLFLEETLLGAGAVAPGFLFSAQNVTEPTSELVLALLTVADAAADNR